MTRMFHLRRRPLAGATFIEYLIVVSALIVAGVIAFSSFGSNSRAHVGHISKELAGMPASMQGGGTGNGGSGWPGSGGAVGSNGGGAGSAGNGTPGAGHDSNGTGGGSGTVGSGIGGPGHAGGGTAWDDLVGGGGLGGVGGNGGGSSGFNPGGDLGGGMACSVDGSDPNTSSVVGSPPTYTLVGNPVNIATGNKYQQEVDYEGGGEFPLTLIRAYNSHAIDEAGSLGPGWQHNYERRISEHDDGRIRV